MKCRKFFIKLCAPLFICTIVGLITACIIAKPISLTEEEISYYTNTAEKVWYNGLERIQKDNKVQVLPINTNKQSITVIFSDSEKIITVNKPIVSFWGCFLFYGIYFGIIIYGIICFCLSKVKDTYRK